MAAAKAEIALGAPPLERAAAYLDAAATSITQRGRVDVGDRTMLDALCPAAEAIRRAADAGLDVAAATRDAAAAADAGARATATMAAKVGRAGWLADRATGHEDAGARLIAMVVSAAERDLRR